MAEQGNKLRWWILLTVIVGTFLGRLDQTIVNLALPSLIDDFGISVAAAGWIATAYILANAVFVPIWGKLGDTIGRKKVYIIGFTVFIFGSVLCGLAWNLSSMIVFRVIQAVAGSADYPTAMAIIAVTFRAPKERAQALGIWSSSFAAATVFGPLIGGPLIDNFGWRSVFLVNLPVGILGLIMALVFIEESKVPSTGKSFDWWGAAVLGVSLSSIVLVLERGIEWGWGSTNSLITYAVAIVFFVIFYRIEQRHEDPIVDFRFFKNKIFTGTLINNFVVFMGMIGAIFIIPVFAQTFLGYNATQAGYLFIPMAAALMLGAPLGGILTGRVNARYVIVASTLVAAIGIFLLGNLDVRSSALDIMIPLSIMAFGLGFGMAQRTNAIASAVPESEIGIASSILALARNLAGAFGIAIFATVLTYTTETNVLETAKNTVINTVNPLVHGQVATLIVLQSQINAYNGVFLLASGLLLIGAISAWFVDVKLEKGKEVHVE